MGCKTSIQLVTIDFIDPTLAELHLFIYCCCCCCGTESDASAYKWSLSHYNSKLENINSSKSHHISKEPLFLEYCTEFYIPLVAHLVYIVC